MSTHQGERLKIEVSGQFGFHSFHNTAESRNQ